MLCGDSTSNGMTVPGKITMSDNPKMGRDSGRDLDQNFGAGRIGRPASPKNADKFSFRCAHVPVIVLNRR